MTETTPTAEETHADLAASRRSIKKLTVVSILAAAAVFATAYALRKSETSSDAVEIPES